MEKDKPHDRETSDPDIIMPGENSISFKVATAVAIFLGFLAIFPLSPLLNDVLDLDDDDADLLFSLSAIFYMFLDPLFLYVPLINEETKCVTLDNRLKIAAIVLRLFGDVRYVARIILHIKNGRQKFHSLKKIAMSIANDTVSILPVPQVVILIFLPKMRGSRSLKIMKFLNLLILLQYLPRLYPIYKECKEVNKQNIAECKKVNKQNIDKGLARIRQKRFAIVFNIIGYILVSHVLGAYWYFFSIQREIDCWGYACRIENGCDFSTSCVEKTFRNITLLNKLCPINPHDPTIFDFGIFLYALQSGMQVSTNFPEKLFQCFSWGLRNLSSFASNLNSSPYGWENLFVVVISISGLLLFMYLLGHAQTFMQGSDKSSRISQKIKPKITSMKSEYELPDELVRLIEFSLQESLEDNENLVVENIYPVLCPELKQAIKFRIFKPEKLMKIFKPRETEEGLTIEKLKEIVKHLEQVSYTGGSYIIREGEPLDMIFFIEHGIVVTYTTHYDGSSGSSETIELKKGDWYGEEHLIPWATRSSSNFSNLPLSTITVKSHKEVDIFALKATDLQQIVSKPTSISNTELDHPTNITGQMEIDVGNS